MREKEKITVWQHNTLDFALAFLLGNFYKEHESVKEKVKMLETNKKNNRYKSFKGH